MQDFDDFDLKPESRGHDVIGFLGLALAVLGIVDLPPAIRLGCLVLGSLFLSLSFQLQMKWPPWARWTLSLIATSFMAFVAWAATSHR
jgi:hypothetical protein